MWLVGVGMVELALVLRIAEREAVIALRSVVGTEGGVQN